MSNGHREQIARVIDKLFDVLADIEIGVALEALGRVTAEFRRAQGEPKIPSRFRETLNTNKHH
jgi:hypothetical protein